MTGVWPWIGAVGLVGLVVAGWRIHVRRDATELAWLEALYQLPSRVTDRQPKPPERPRT